MKSCATIMFVSAPIYRFTIHNLFVFRFQSKSWGIAVCCHVRSEQTGHVRNLSKKKIGELQHLLTLLMVVFILNPYNGSTALSLQFSCQFNRVISRLAQWLSGRVLDSSPKGRGFEPHRPHCAVVLEQDTFILA